MTGEIMKDKGYKQKADEYYEKLIRLQAETENIKKRLDKDRVEFVKFANIELIAELIDIIDDFHRAADAAKQSKDVKALIDGVDMITSNMSQLLKRRGLEEINKTGIEFDADTHEAVGTVENSEHPENTVVEILRKGYTLNGRAIRPAMVKVAKKK